MPTRRESASPVAATARAREHASEIGREHETGTQRAPLETQFRKGKPALICYLPLGDPEAPAEIEKLYADAGVDVFEIGVPGASPKMDGPVIADSLVRAQRAGVTSRRAARLISQMREKHPQLGAVWFTYPPRDNERLVESVLASGVDGFLVPDLARNHVFLARQLERRGVTFVHFLPHDPHVRDVVQTAQRARGYVMLQANPGRTGDKPRVLPDNSTVISLLRRLGLETPLALGIGISTPEQARAAIAMGADGVIIGSSVVEAMLKGRSSLQRLLRGLRHAIDEQ